MFAAHYKLDNLCIAVDVNGLQIDGATKNVMNSEPLDKKFAVFGCEVVTIDEHDFDTLERTFAIFQVTQDKSTVILMKTVKGKAVSFMENVAGWYGKVANKDQLAQALAELEDDRKKILEET